MSSGPEPAARVGLGALAGVQTIIGGWMVLAPGSFTTRVAPFGARNDHLLRDLASWELALAVIAALAVTRPTWRVPVVALALLHYTLHALNHLVDLGQADPAWVGVADLLSLSVGAAALVWLLQRVRGVSA